MSTTIDTVTNDQIKTLRDEADAHGDNKMSDICQRALGYTAGVRCAETMTVDAARAECARVIGEAEARDE